MKKNNAFRSILCGLILLCTVFMIFSACTETGENQTSEPSADVFADPTEKATIVPITLQPVSPAPPTPEPVLTHDYEMLKAFFDMPSKVEGKTNGELIFRNYESGNPYSWYVYNDLEHYQLDDTDEFIPWATDGGSSRYYSGNIKEIATGFLKDEQMLNCSGTLLLDGLEHLESIKLFNVSADELIVTNCDKLTHVYLSSGYHEEDYHPYFDKICIDARLWACYSVPCAREFGLINSYPEQHRDFDITVIADGDGLVCVVQEMDTNYDHVLVWAKANEGSHFVGWYDEEGRLVSEDEKFMLTEWDQFEDFNDIATYTAKFEKN